MNHRRAYWLIRAVTGFGVIALVAVIVTVLAIADGSLAGASLSDVRLCPVVIGGVFGILWDSVVAAGIAGWVVYGDPRQGVPHPPLMAPEPRGSFDR